MYLGIYTVLCCAILAGFASIAQASGPSDLTFSEETAVVEGSGNGADVNRDVEASGSGFGPEDDEDTADEEKVIQRTSYNAYVPKIDNVGKVGKETKSAVLPDRNDFTTSNPIGRDDRNQENHHKEVEMNRKEGFFTQPGILAAVIGGAVVGLLCAILVVMFIVYRMRKKDEGSYALGEPKQSPTANSYSRGNNKEFYA